MTFKAGDTVRMVTDCSPLKKGDICELMTVIHGDLRAIKVGGESREAGYICSGPHHWELVEEQKFKKGDRVKILSKSTHMSLASLKSHTEFRRWYPEFPFATVERYSDSHVVLGGNYFLESDLELVSENPTMEGGEKNVANFNVGDRVIHARPCGKTGTGEIGTYRFDGAVWPVPESPSQGWLCRHLDTWDPISDSQTNIMALQTVTQFEQEHLDADALAVRKVGLIDSSGSLNTYKLDEMMYKLNFKELAALAKSEVAEEEAKLAVEKTKKSTK